MKPTVNKPSIIKSVKSVFRQEGGIPNRQQPTHPSDDGRSQICKSGSHGVFFLITDQQEPKSDPRPVFPSGQQPLLHLPMATQI
ncbi:hypothetical protein ACLOJK_018833 [Asimina triloba]